MMGLAAYVFLSTMAGVAAMAGEALPEWGIYIYMCGSDLESENGAASADLIEMMEASLPEDVTVVVETGGAAAWQLEAIDPDYLERYIIDGEDSYCIDQQPLASMGESETFAQFLSFCTQNYPAQKEAVILWDHGGTSAEGAIFDELFDYDGLTITEMQEAFQQVFGDRSEENSPNEAQSSGESPAAAPFEFVGFDACLMATVDAVNMLQGYASYMVASEENEPGCGWEYDGFLTGLGEDPSMSGDQAGILICDSFLDGCRSYGDYQDCTLSVVDVDASKALVEAYDNMGAEALVYACGDASFFSRFGRGAASAENFGTNTQSAGYCGMVDLGDLARQNQDLIPQTYEDVIQTLDSCVVYKVNGSYKTNSSGLSCYYAMDGDVDNLENIVEVSASDCFAVYYDYMLTGELDEDLKEYISEVLGYEGTYAQPDTISTAGTTQEDLPVKINEEGYAVLTLDEQTANAFSDICFDLIIYDEEDDVMLYLGSDNDLEGDWDSGVFRDNFRGVWGCLDGCLCHMEISYSCDDYTFYCVPILLNGEEYNLKVIYDFSDEQYHILGANKGIDDNGMADKNTIPLKPGDQVTTLHYVSTLSGDDDLQQMEMDTITVTENTAFTEEDLGDGDYMMMFHLKDVQGEALYSQAVGITVEDGEITETV